MKLTYFSTFAIILGVNFVLAENLGVSSSASMAEKAALASRAASEARSSHSINTPPRDLALVKLEKQPTSKPLNTDSAFSKSLEEVLKMKRTKGPLTSSSIIEESATKKQSLGPSPSSATLEEQTKKPLTNPSASSATPEEQTSLDKKPSTTSPTLLSLMASTEKPGLKERWMNNPNVRIAKMRWQAFSEKLGRIGAQMSLPGIMKAIQRNPRKAMAVLLVISAAFGVINGIQGSINGQILKNTMALNDTRRDKVVEASTVAGVIDGALIPSLIVGGGPLKTLISNSVASEILGVNKETLKKSVGANLVAGAVDNTLAFTPAAVVSGPIMASVHASVMGADSETSMKSTSLAAIDTNTAMLMTVLDDDKKYRAAHPDSNKK